jgi:hypothetical protein
MGAKVPNIPELANNPRFDLVVIQGLAEALSPSILGFSILCAVGFIAAIGERRLSHSLSLRVKGGQQIDAAELVQVQ